MNKKFSYIVEEANNYWWIYKQFLNYHPRDYTRMRKLYNQRAYQRTLSSLLFVCMISITVALTSKQNEHQTADEIGFRNYQNLPKIFNFQEYQDLYHKSYLPSEEPVRRKLMLARALRAFISGYKYKLGRSTSYLAVNHLSDKTPEELAKMSNKHLEDTLDYDHKTSFRIIESEGQENPINDLDNEFPQIDPIKIESDLLKLTSDELDPSLLNTYGPGLKELKEILAAESEHQRLTTKNRVKRDAQGTPKDQQKERTGPYRKHLSQKISLIEQPNARLNRQTFSKVRNPPSNNPNYMAPEDFSYGLRDEKQESVRWSRIMSKAFFETLKNHALEGESNLKRVSESLQHQASLMRVKKYARNPNLPDQVFIDHRTTNCFFLPRDQQGCGSCYAYASTALIEWLNCMKTGTLIAFSEQYMIDCGHAAGCKGCEGSPIENVSSFVHNYGLELRINYMPLMSYRNDCPYNEDTDPSTMGYIRMDLKESIQVNVDLFEDYLLASPLIITLKTEKTSFMEYGGGIHLGQDCANIEAGDHAVLLVGHGREDGLEYWLIRNSYSVSWGEEGYMKLWKGSSCIHPEYGYIFGTTDGIEYPSPNGNPNHNIKLIRQKYAESVRTHLKNRSKTVPV